MLRLITHLVIVSVLFVAPSVFAFDWTTRELITHEFDVPAGQTYTLSLGNVFQVKNLVIQARSAYREAGVVDILVNGDIKGTIYVPGSDPSYVVTVGEGASNIQFVSRSGASIRVQKVIGTVSATGAFLRATDFSVLFMPQNEVTELCRLTIRSIETLLAWTTAEDQEKYLMPMKVAAGRLFAVATSRGSLSNRTIQGIQALISQFDLAQAFFDRHLTCSECFNDVVQLLTIRERFEKAIQ